MNRVKEQIRVIMHKLKKKSNENNSTIQWPNGWYERKKKYIKVH